MDDVRFYAGGHRVEEAEEIIKRSGREYVKIVEERCSALRRALKSSDFTNQRIQFVRSIPDFVLIEGRESDACRCPACPYPGPDLTATVPPQNPSRAWYMAQRFIDK